MNLVFRAFRPEIEWLQDEKARAIGGYRRAHGGRDLFEDRSVEILSRVDIHFEQGGEPSSSLGSIADPAPAPPATERTAVAPTTSPTGSSSW